MPQAGAPAIRGGGRPGGFGPDRAGRVRLRAGRLAASCALVLGAFAATAAEPRLELMRLTYVASRAGTAELLLEAERGRYDPAARVVDLESVRVMALEGAQSPGLEMTSDSARLWLDTNDFRAEGRVRGRTADGRRFLASWVAYDRAQGLLRTDAPVTLYDGGTALRGGGFRYTVRTGRLRLVGGASVSNP